MKSKRFWILIGLGVMIIFLLILISSVISVGERLRNINGYVELSFYFLTAVLLYLLILNPILVILFAPAISIENILENDTKKNRKIYKRIAKNILSSNMLDEIDKNKLKHAINRKETLNDELTRVYNKTIKKKLDKIVMRNAKTVMISTAISQNGRLDLFTVLAINLKMIKELVNKCGFRPSLSKLGKLSLNVLTTSLIAEGLENINLEDILPSQTTSFLNEIPFMKSITSSIVQGTSNALLTIRIGIITRKFLFSDTKITSKTQIRIEAFKEALSILPIVIKDSLSIFPKKFKNIFKNEGKARET